MNRLAPPAHGLHQARAQGARAGGRCMAGARCGCGGGGGIAMRHRRVELYCGAQLGGEVARVLQEEIQTGLQVFALLEKLEARQRGE